MGLFDSISGIFQSGLDFVTDFGGGAFAAVDERLRGGTISPGAAAGFARTAGQAVGNIFGQIGESFLTSQLSPGVPTTTTSAGRQLSQQTAPQQLRAAIAAAQARAPGGGIIAQPLQFAQPAPRAPAFVERRVPQQAGLGQGIINVLGSLAGDVLFDLLPSVEQVKTFAQAPLGGEMANAVALPGGSVIPGGGGLMSAPSAVPLAGRVFNTFQNLNTGAVSMRARPLLMFQNPMTGNPVWYRNAGRPVLWSGDLATCKRVNRIARKVARRRPR